MAQSLAPVAASLIAPKCQKTDRSSSSPGFQTMKVSESETSGYNLHRRDVARGLAGAVALGLSTGEWSANAAARKPPPPPAKKKDPTSSGVQAKVLASKKRKEAMKQSVAKLREKGKAVDE